MMDLKMIPCIICKNPMPELRLIKFNYNRCVDCSNVGAYEAISTSNGSGDNTWNDIQILTPEQSKLVKKEQNRSSNFDSYNN
tara:strand:+ start:1469 stop:1714 length:246 start_codon:yes stop_codon:yes gene_type:complete